MKLKEIDKDIFQIDKDIHFDVSDLYFDYGDKEIYDLLKQNSISHFIIEKIKVKPSISYMYQSKFSYHKHNDIKNNYNHFYFILINNLTPAEQTSLFNFCMSQKERSFALTMLKNPEVKLNTEQFDKIFNLELGKDYYAYDLKKALIENKNICLTEEQINQGLINYDDGLNCSYAVRGESCIRLETIDTLLCMKEMYSNDTLIQLLENKNLQLNQHQVEKLLTHERFDVKVACAQNYQLPFTEEQIIRGLHDEGYDDCDGYGTPFDDYNQDSVVSAFLNNPNIKIPSAEITNMLKGKNNYISAEDVVIKNLLLDAEQIDMIINRYDYLTLEYMKNKEVKLNDQQILKMLYKDENWPKYLTKYYLRFRQELEKKEFLDKKKEEKLLIKNKIKKLL